MRTTVKPWDVSRYISNPQLLVINQNFNSSFLSCEWYKALRDAAVTTSNPTSFNQFLSEQIKASFSSGGRHKKFWDDLSSDPIFPISTEEVSSSDVSASEGCRFYTIDGPADTLVSQKMTEAVEDDLFDDLE